MNPRRRRIAKLRRSIARTARIVVLPCQCSVRVIMVSGVPTLPRGQERDVDVCSRHANGRIGRSWWRALSKAVA